jgi:hypothetical protein
MRVRPQGHGHPALDSGHPGPRRDGRAAQRVSNSLHANLFLRPFGASPSMALIGPRGRTLMRPLHALQILRAQVRPGNRARVRDSGAAVILL